MLCALIMAGGKGTRFWPLSTEEKPKQFLNLIGKETMIQMTVSRIKSIIPIERIFVCTGERYVSLVKEQLPELPKRNIIIEPEGRNTAPCIALSALIMSREYSDANMVVLPSDHLINNEKEFKDIVKNANEFLYENDKAIITLGITPTRPEIGYGYIKYGENINNIKNHQVLKVEAFVEKPNRRKAEEYLKNGSYLWNGGMFVWKISSIIEKIKEYLPNTYEALNEINSADQSQVQMIINNKYKFTDSISIDYGILEKDNEIYVIPSEIQWDDIGSWDAISRYRAKDIDGNIHIGEVSGINSKNNIIVSSSNQIIVNGLSDIYVVENDGKILIGKKSNIDEMKELKQLVKRREL